VKKKIIETNISFSLASAPRCTVQMTQSTYKFGCRPGERPERTVSQTTKTVTSIHPYFGEAFTFSLNTNKDMIKIAIPNGPSHTFDIAGLRKAATATEVKKKNKTTSPHLLLEPNVDWKWLKTRHRYPCSQ